MHMSPPVCFFVSIHQFIHHFRVEAEILSFVCPTFLSVIVITLIQHTISYGCFFITSSGHFLCNFLLSTCNFHHIIIMQPAFVLLRTFPFTNIQTTIF
ncbi:hypothetical protein GDO81_026688 [Engystomops pustulosus]|uniref:Uncharacterized protein n=1 Tax=Engystomops pustulosus TaxID=76066 RepID=A0AAV6YJL6_ENGPU|nr:hypothetical protein GDO81_028554 [Engystomops pustulosus]KAG8536298.1 hypothetical protein GDO81_026688 [Engystomops pustulosus]